MKTPLFSEHLEGRALTETARGDLLFLEEWERLAPGLVAGITTARAGTYSVSSSPGDDLIAAYTALAGAVGFGLVAVPRQIHGCEVLPVGAPGAMGRVDREGPSATGVLLAGRVDGLATAERGVLLASTAADCVPVYLLDHLARRVALVHAGWRGVAGGILARGVDALEALGAERARMRAHLGPAICGSCYEVDRPVLEKLGRTEGRALVDLRGALAGQAETAGVPPDHVTVSTFCTSCGSEDLHSHRASGGKAGRMAAFTGFREEPGEGDGGAPRQVAS